MQITRRRSLFRTTSEAIYAPLNSLTMYDSRECQQCDMHFWQLYPFEKEYKGEVSKSGVAILPSKRMRKAPIQNSSTPDDTKEESEKTLKLTEEVKAEGKISYREPETCAICAWKIPRQRQLHAAAF